MNIRTRAEEKHWAEMCKAGEHKWKFIGSVVQDPVVDCCSISVVKIYKCTRCKAYAQKRYR